MSATKFLDARGVDILLAQKMGVISLFAPCILMGNGVVRIENKNKRKTASKLGTLDTLCQPLYEARCETKILNPNEISVYSGTPVEEINAIPG